MFVFSAPLFWYKLVFIGELLLAEGLTVYTLKRRNHFFLRLFLSVLCIIIVSFLYPLFTFSYNAAYTSIMFLFLFGMTLIGMKICFDESWINIIFCGIIAYTTQHIAFETFNFFVSVAGIGTYNVYGSEMNMQAYDPFSIITYLGIYALVYWFVWAFVAYRIRCQKKLVIDNIPLLGGLAIIIVVAVILNAVMMYHGGEVSLIVSSVVYIYNMLSCILAVSMLFSILGKNIAEKELEIVQNLWMQDIKAYELRKESVDLINVKCHDLRKQIRALSSIGGNISKDVLSDIEHAVNIYDGIVKTGNDVLDVIFAEKSLYCEKHNITLSCIADGESLGFMAQPDIYSLFENALQNAIEAVDNVDDVEKRIVKMKITRKGNLLSVHTENYCSVMPEFVDGLPATTKTDNKGWHGYGVKSMLMIAEKYGGGLKTSVIGEMFYLDILLQISQSRQK